MKPYGSSEKGWCCDFEDGPVDAPHRKRTAGKAAKHRNRSLGRKDIKNQLRDLEPDDLKEKEYNSTDPDTGITYIIIGG